jgi:tetratricopeptide (TPR) repeat protein
MFRFKLILILSILTYLSGFSQQDSLIQKIKSYRYTDKKEYLTDLLKADSISGLKFDNKDIAIIKSKLGSYFYQKDYNKAIQYYDTAALYYNKCKDKFESNCYLNIAGIYDEQLGQNLPAIKYLNKSLKIAEIYKDTLQQATVLKYLGALKGKEKDFKQGKSDIKRAIDLFINKDFKRGVAVCYFDLAIVYFYETNFDSCIISLNTSKDIQRGFNNIERIFGINNYLLKVYLTKQDLINFDLILKENETTINDEKVHDFDRISYFKTLIDYYDLKKDNTKIIEYKGKLLALNNKLNNH